MHEQGLILEQALLNEGGVEGGHEDLGNGAYLNKIQVCGRRDRGARALDDELGVPTPAGDAHDRIADREAIDPMPHSLDRARVLQAEDLLAVASGCRVAAFALQQVCAVHA